MFVNSSPQRWLADGGLSFLHLTHVGTTPYSKQRHCDVTIKLSLHYIQDNFFFYENVDGRHIAKNRHIAKPSTSQMWNPQEMIPTKYLKDRLTIVGGAAFWKKVYE